MIVLDTNVLSEFIRPRPEPAVLSWADSLPGDHAATTAVTVAEQLAGVAQLPVGARRDRLSTGIARLLNDGLGGRILPFDAAAASHYAEIVTVRRAAGRPIGTPDAQIAAICRSVNAVLATRNTKDFEAVGVELINPWLASAG